MSYDTVISQMRRCRCMTAATAAVAAVLTGAALASDPRGDERFPREPGDPVWSQAPAVELTAVHGPWLALAGGRWMAAQSVGDGLLVEAAGDAKPLAAAAGGGNRGSGPPVAG